MIIQKDKANLSFKTPHKPLAGLSGARVGKGTDKAASPYLPLNRVSRPEVWALAKSKWGDEIPSKTAWAIWGAAIVDARRTEDCPLCGWAGGIYLLCPYHQYRQCECGAVLGTVMPCQCDPE